MLTSYGQLFSMLLRVYCCYYCRCKDHHLAKTTVPRLSNYVVAAAIISIAASVKIIRFSHSPAYRSGSQIDVADPNTRVSVKEKRCAKRKRARSKQSSEGIHCLRRVKSRKRETHTVASVLSCFAKGRCSALVSVNKSVCLIVVTW